MAKKIKLPRGTAEFGSVEEDVWDRVVMACEQRIKSYEEGLLIDRAFLKLAKKKRKKSKL